MIDAYKETDEQRKRPRLNITDLMMLRLRNRTLTAKVKQIGFDRSAVVRTINESISNVNFVGNKYN